MAAKRRRKPASEKRRQSLREARRRLMQDPVRREAWRLKVLATRAKNGSDEKVSQLQIAHWQDPEKRASHCQSYLESWQDPARVGHQSETFTRLWAEEEYGDKMRASRASAESKELQSVVSIEKWQNEGYRRQQTASHEAYARQPGVHAKLVERGRLGLQSLSKVVWVYEGPSGIIPMRGRNEVAFAKWCDKKRIKWLYEPHRIIWEYQDRKESYRPDFFLPKFHLYVEIKGRMFPGQQERYKKFRSKYPDLKWIMIVVRKIHPFKAFGLALAEVC